MFRLKQVKHETIEGSMFPNKIEREIERFNSLEEAKDFYQRNKDLLTGNGSSCFVEEVKFVTTLE